MDNVDPQSLDPMRDQSGAAPTTQGLQGDPSVWERIQQALKSGLISSAQYQQLAAKMGYTPQNVGQTPPAAAAPAKGGFATGVKDPDYTGSQSPAGNLGTTAGNIVGQIGTGLAKAATAPSAPGAPMDISGGGINPPSPAWNN